MDFNAFAQFAQALATDAIRVIALTPPLGSSPPIWPFKIEEISGELCS